VSSAVKGFAANGKKIAELGEVVDKLDDIAEESLEGIGKSIDDIAGKSINKGFRDGSIDGPSFENSHIEVQDLATKKGRKLSFPELQALWKRGNDFNEKARDNIWYTDNEVVVEHPTLKYLDGPNKGKPKRFRLDSYNVNDVIVSRKATDLAKIQQSTFEAYLNELTKKYPVGSKILNSKRKIGETLQGKFVLEIPESNKSLERINEYIQIVKSKVPSVDIVFKPE